MPSTTDQRTHGRSRWDYSPSKRRCPWYPGLIENSRHREELREITLAAIEPISGLHQAIEDYYEHLRVENSFRFSGDGYSGDL